MHLNWNYNQNIYVLGYPRCGDQLHHSLSSIVMLFLVPFIGMQSTSYKTNYILVDLDMLYLVPETQC